MKKIMGIILAMMVLLSACGKSENDKIELLEPANAKMESTYVTRVDMSDRKLYDGKVLPNTDEFSFEYSGYLYDVFVYPGQHVSKGDVLAGLKSSHYDEVTELEEQIEELTEKNEKNFEKLNNELELAKLSGGDVEEKEMEIRQQQELAELELSQKKERMEILSKDDFGYVYIEAPYDSTVVAVTNMPAGGFVSAGTAVVALDNGQSPIITCEFISEANIGVVEAVYAMVRGNRYDLKYIPYSKIELKVMVTNEVTPVSKFVLRDGNGDGMYVGDYASVVVEKSNHPNVLAVPVNAIYSDASGKFVYEIIDEQRVRRDVKTGISDSVYVEIVEGIEEGACIYVKN